MRLPSLPRAARSFYGCKTHAAVSARTDLPFVGRIETAKANESRFSAPLIDPARAHGFAVETLAMDKGYDHNRVMHDSRERGCIPIVALCRGAQSRSALAAVATVAVIVWLVIAGWSFGGY